MAKKSRFILEGKEYVRPAGVPDDHEPILLKRRDGSSRQNRAKAPEGSQNQSESTLALPSDCPTK